MNMEDFVEEFLVQENGIQCQGKVRQAYESMWRGDWNYAQIYEKFCNYLQGTEEKSQAFVQETQKKSKKAGD